jgi:sugar phosphate isomerase/epimerase
MYYTGFADEAAHSLAGQIKATKELGWSRIESRKIDGTNIHDLGDEAFAKAAAQLEAANVTVNCFGSAIGNWAKHVDQPDEPSLAEARRAIPRMQRLGTKLIRIMSYTVLKERGPEDQMEQERFRRLREIARMFLDAGLQPVHENCNNYGGMGAKYTLRLIENVPGLKLVFDTGNPVHVRDCGLPKGADGQHPRQSSWDFYAQVKAHVAYVHIKDARWDAAKNHAVHTWPGEGEGDVRRIVKDLLGSGYDGGFSIEPHLAVVHHDPSITSPEAIMHANYVEYGQRFAKLVTEVRAELGIGTRSVAAKH